MEEVVSFFGKFASIRATYLFISHGDEKVFIGKKEAKIGKKKKQLIFGKNDSRVRSSERKNEALSKKGVKKSASSSCPVDFWCSKLPSLLRLSFKGGFDR